MTQISNKVIPVHSDAYFSRYDQVLLISTYENNIRFSKKQDKARYLARTNSWVKPEKSLTEGPLTESLCFCNTALSARNFDIL